ncbi:MAG: recombinase RecT [Rhodomicrobium sp.]
MMSALLHFTPGDIALIRRTVAASYNDDEFRTFMHLCRRTGLDPLRRQCYAFVFHKDNKDQSYRKLTLVTGIEGLRAIAARTGCYRPDENEPDYYYLPSKLEREEELTKARSLPSLKDRKKALSEIEEALPADPLNPLGLERVVTHVWKHAHGGWHKCAGEAWWSEFVPIREEWEEEHLGSKWRETGKTSIDPKKESWIKMPRLMLAKCAEAQALRKGWPDDLSAVYEDSETHRETTRLDAVEAVRIANEQARLERQKRNGEEILFDFGPNTPIEFVAIGKLADRCLAFIEANQDKPELLSAWYSRNRTSIREFHAKRKAEAIAIAKRLDEVLAEAKLKQESTRAQAQKAAE